VGLPGVLVTNAFLSLQQPRWWERDSRTVLMPLSKF
jgi:hypothetical protein